MAKYRIGFLNTHPIQYFAPLYAYLNASGDFDVTAFYLSDYSVRGAVDADFGQAVKWDIDLLDGYRSVFAKGYATRGQMRGFWSVLALDLFKRIRSSGLDALVVHGHTPAAMLVGMAAAKSAGVPLFMRCETHLGLRRSRAKSAARRLLNGALYRTLDGALAIGTANAAFYHAMGVPAKRVFSVPYTVDNARFCERSELASAKRETIRKSLGVVDERPIILYAAKFQRRKRPDDLLRAAAAVDPDSPFHLAMIGTGEMDAELKSLAVALGLRNISFPGFVNQAALPEIYGASDVFVLPSEDEPWGLAVNEAMCAGLPVVVSSEIGSVSDLVHDGCNGFTFAAGDVGALAGALKRLVVDAEMRAQMSAESRAIIAGWSYAECRDGLLEAIGATARGRR